MAELLVVKISSTPNAQYNASKGRNCGITQLILGVLSIACGATAIDGEAGESGLDLGYSIWGGAIYCTAGLLGILSYKRTTCVIVGCMVTSIVSAVCAFGQIGWEMLNAYYDLYCCPLNPIIFHGIAVLIGFIELFPSIISAINCSRGSSCYCGCCIECIGTPREEPPHTEMHLLSTGPATNYGTTLVANTSDTQVAMTSHKHELPPYSEHIYRWGAVNHVEDHGQEFKKA